MERDTTSRDARSFAVGAYRSMKRSPSELRRMPPSPRDPSVIRQPAPSCQQHKGGTVSQMEVALHPSPLKANPGA
eukprot:349824-Chlamydomonas_euryale.AAC.15